MVAEVRSIGKQAKHSIRGGVTAPPASVKTVRPKLFRRASLTSWGKDNLGMTRAAADVNIKELMLTVQQQKYEDRDKAVQREISHTASCLGEECTRQRSARRAGLLSRSCARRHFLVAWEMEGRVKWNRNQAALCRYERRLLSYELAVKERASAWQRISRARHASDAGGGVQWFEKNLDKLGLDPGSDQNNAGCAGAAALSPDKESRATFRSKLLRTVLDQNFVPSSNAEAIAELHFRGNAGRRARHEREHRRLKTEVDQRHAKAEADAQCAAEERMESMLRIGRERRAAAAAHRQRLRTREEAALRDTERFAALAATERDAFESAFIERAAGARERFAAGEAERRATTDALHNRLRMLRDEKRQRSELLCIDVLLKMVDLAVVASEMRADRGGIPLPPTMWARLKRWFCSPDPFFPSTVPSAPTVKLRNPVGEANALLQRRNLDCYEGRWRPCGFSPAVFTKEKTPLETALSVATTLVEATGTGPRESPRSYFDNGPPCAEGAKPWGLSTRLVLLGTKGTLDSVRAELANWTGLYCCDLEKALKCATDLGAEMAAADTKSSSGKKKKASSVAIRKSIVDSSGVPARGDGGEGGVAGAAAAAESVGLQTRLSISSRAFHPSAYEEDIAAFKEAAIAYHALRTNPKKAGAPVPLATTSDILVKHLACRSPRGRSGWILVGYPRLLIEAKMLEHALTGNSDDDVLAELRLSGKGTKADAKKKKGSIVVAGDVTQPPPPISGVDAVLNISREISQGTSPDATDQGRSNIDIKYNDGDNGTSEGVKEQNGNEGLVAGKATPLGTNKTSSELTMMGTVDHDEEEVPKEERRSLLDWYSTFEGGQLASEVPNETSNERVLETLFLLTILAQKRKDDRQAWAEEQTRAQDMLAEQTAATSVDDDSPADAGIDSWAISSHGEDATRPSKCRPSPLGVPLRQSLKIMRNDRRRKLSHATRIRVEALTEERILDVEAIRAAIATARTGNDPERTGSKDAVQFDTTSPTKVLQKVEEECTASLVLDWTAATEFAFAQELRAQDERWTAARLRLENEIADFVERSSSAAAGEKRVRLGKPDASDRSVPRGDCGAENIFSMSPAAENDHVWDALESFELEAGNVVDDRHATVDDAFHEIEAGASRRVTAWTRGASRAAADLCEAERDVHRKAVATLRSLDVLFGLEPEPCSVNFEAAKTFACTAADGLKSTTVAQTVEGKCIFWGDRGCPKLEEELRFACEQVNGGVLPTDNSPYAGESCLAKTQARNVEESRASVVEDSSNVNHCFDEREQESNSLGMGSDETGTTKTFEYNHAAEGGMGQVRDSKQESSGSTGSEEHRLKLEEGEDAIPESEVLATALWKCRYGYICRVWGIVARLAKAVHRCESLTSAAEARMRSMKRHRVRLEHEAVSLAASTVKRALANCDEGAIAAIVEHGIPLWVEDDETIAADPSIALSWGMNGLSLTRIASLALTLRRVFGAAGVPAVDGVGVVDLASPAPSSPELADVVRTWAREEAAAMAQERAFGVGQREAFPPAWVSDDTNGYTARLCAAVCCGGHAEANSWKKLVHCLLLGHISAIPTLEELRAMRHAFEQEQNSSWPDAPRSSKASVATPQDGITAVQEHRKSILGLKTAESRCAGNVQLWFEKSLCCAGIMEEERTGESGNEYRKRATKDGGISSTLTAIYFEVWGDDDRQLNALELMLTLCAVPNEEEVEEANVVDGDTSNDGRTGVPFSNGLFRAFSLLVDPPCPTTNSSMSTLNRLCANTSCPSEPLTAPGETGVELVTLAVDGNPHLSLPQLSAILQYGGTMSPEESLKVFEAAWTIDETARKKRQHESVTTSGDCLEECLAADDFASPTLGVEGPTAGDGIAKDMGGKAIDKNRRHSDDAEGQSATEGAASKPAGDVQADKRSGGASATRDSAAELDSTAESDDGKGAVAKEAAAGIVVGEEPADSKQRMDAMCGSIDAFVQAERALKVPRKVSFAAVSECDEVRSRIRRGAWTLPSFGVLSGCSSLFP